MAPHLTLGGLIESMALIGGERGVQGASVESHILMGCRLRTFFHHRNKKGKVLSRITGEGDMTMVHSAVNSEDILAREGSHTQISHFFCVSIYRKYPEETTVHGERKEIVVCQGLRKWGRDC